jgi:hypothetical protein
MHSIKCPVVSSTQCRRKAGDRTKKGLCVWTLGTFYDECSLWMHLVIGNFDMKGDFCKIGRSVQMHISPNLTTYRATIHT